MKTTSMMQRSIATLWGEDAAELPLEAERARFISELHGVLLVLAFADPAWTRGG